MRKKRLNSDAYAEHVRRKSLITRENWLKK